MSKSLPESEAGRLRHSSLGCGGWILKRISSSRLFGVVKGDGQSWDLDQDRTHNLVNEIYNETPGNAITEQSDPQQSKWADPVYSARGNATSIPKPIDLENSYACKYDAWNRLAFVWVDSNSDGDHDAGETVIARYEYDGLGRRVKKHLNKNLAPVAQRIESRTSNPKVGGSNPPGRANVSLFRQGPYE